MSQWENLTSPDFKKEVARSGRVCVIALGVIEKHGGHCPLGIDLFNVHKMACMAAEIERAVVFPPYYLTQILEAKHQPGTIAIDPDLMLKLLENVCDEIGRNGFKKIIILNGHGGNQTFLPFFVFKMLNKKKSYIVYYPDEPWKKWAEISEKYLGKSRRSGHGGDLETSVLMAISGELVKMEDVNKACGKSLERLKHLGDISTPVWWYARYPDHYAGDAKGADKKSGEVVIRETVELMVDAIRKVKKDKTAPKLYEEFFKKTNH